MLVNHTACSAALPQTRQQARENPSMSFDEENNETTQSEKKQGKTFFGLELSDGVVYTIVIILALVFIRQAIIVLQAL
jgi:hypothetical protein